jgi:hypothetical protein
MRANSLVGVDQLAIVMARSSRTSTEKGTETMAIDVLDERQEIVAFYEEVVRDLDRRLARIERTRHDTYRSVPAWQHLTRRRAYFLRLRAEA